MVHKVRRGPLHALAREVWAQFTDQLRHNHRTRTRIMNSFSTKSDSALDTRDQSFPTRSMKVFWFPKNVGSHVRMSQFHGRCRLCRTSIVLSLQHHRDRWPLHLLSLQQRPGDNHLLLCCGTLESDLLLPLAERDGEVTEGYFVQQFGTVSVDEHEAGDAECEEHDDATDRIRRELLSMGGMLHENIDTEVIESTSDVGSENDQRPLPSYRCGGWRGLLFACCSLVSRRVRSVTKLNRTGCDANTSGLLRAQRALH